MSVIPVQDPEKIEYVQNLFPEAQLQLLVGPDGAIHWEEYNFVSVPKRSGTKSQSSDRKDSQN